VCQLFSAFDMFTVSFPKQHYEATKPKQLHCNYHALTELFLSGFGKKRTRGLMSKGGGVAKGLRAGGGGGGGICEAAPGGRVQGEGKGIF